MIAARVFIEGVSGWHLVSWVAVLAACIGVGLWVSR